MNDLEISKALALAIGWTENRLDENGCLDPDVAIFGHGGYCQHYGEPDEVKCWDGDDWVTFDYTDWRVIGPIAAKYNAFPYRVTNREEPQHLWKWNSITRGDDHIEDTPQKAIAMAVIGLLK